MLIEFERDAPHGQGNPVAINTDHVWHVSPGSQRGSSGQATTTITFINDQSINVIGPMDAILQKLEWR